MRSLNEHTVKNLRRIKKITCPKCKDTGKILHLLKIKNTKNIWICKACDILFTTANRESTNKHKLKEESEQLHSIDLINPLTNQKEIQGIL